MNHDEYYTLISDLREINARVPESHFPRVKYTAL